MAERGRKRAAANCGEFPCRWNFDWPFGWPNDVRFGPNFEEVFYLTRGTILRWPIVILTVKFLDLWYEKLTLKL